MQSVSEVIGSKTAYGVVCNGSQANGTVLSLPVPVLLVDLHVPEEGNRVAVECYIGHGGSMESQLPELVQKGSRRVSGNGLFDFTGQLV